MGHQLEAFDDAGAIGIGQLEMVNGPIAHAAGQRQLEGPLTLGEGLRWLDGVGLATIDAELEGPLAQGPSEQHIALEASKARPAAKSGAAELAEQLVALGIEAQGAPRQLEAALAIEKSAHHHATGARGQFPAGMAQEGKTTGGQDSLGLQVGAGALGERLGQHPAAGRIKQILQNQDDLEWSSG